MNTNATPIDTYRISRVILEELPDDITHDREGWTLIDVKYVPPLAMDLTLMIGNVVAGLMNEGDVRDPIIEELAPVIEGILEGYSDDPHHGNVA